MNQPNYNKRKALESAAYLLNKAPSQQEYHILIVKMIYIAERRALQRWGRLITWDHFVSMDQGPVPSQTLSLISGSMQDSVEWDKYISAQEENKISLLKMPEIEELSHAELKLLDEVYEEFGSMIRWDVVDLTHKFSEWTDPKGSAIPIELEEILEAGDISSERIGQIREELSALANAQSILAGN